MTINLDTTEQQMNALYAASSGSLPAPINPNLSPKDLIDLVRKHKNKLYSGALYELIAGHKSAGDRVFNELLRLKDSDSTIANAVATSGKASAKMLKKLAVSSSVHVKDHAKLALLQRALANSSAAEFQSMLQDQYSGDDQFSIAARYLIACYSTTPKEILMKLAEDDYDHISKAAIQNLRRE